MPTHKKVYVAIALLAALTFSCQSSSPQPSATPAATRTPTTNSTPTHTASHTSTLTTTPSNTPTPSITPTSTQTYTPRPTRTPKPTETPTATPTVLTILKNNWETTEVRTVCLSVEQTYPEFDSKDEEPIAEKLAQILGALSIRVVLDGEACDATLTANLTGVSAKDKYMFTGENKTCYSGSAYLGEMLLSAAQKPNFIVEIQGHDTPISISKCREEPYEHVKWENSWKPAVVGGIGQIWGKNGLLLILSTPELKITCTAARQLYPVRKALVPEDLPFLVPALQACPEAVASLLKAMGVQAWDAVPALLDAWKEMGPDEVTRGTLMGYGTVIFQEALVKITETFEPRPDCNTQSCWRSWWGTGQPMP